MHTVYLLVCPIENRVRYVGCSVNPETRLKSHISVHNGIRGRLGAWFGRLRNIGSKPKLFVWKHFEDRISAEDEERDLISHLPGLFNKTHNRY